MATPIDVNGADEISAMTLTLTGRLKQQLRTCAIRLGCSISELARTMIREGLEKRLSTQPPKGGHND
jgi:hypothetical protein